MTDTTTRVAIRDVAAAARSLRATRQARCPHDSCNKFAKVEQVEDGYEYIQPCAEHEDECESAAEQDAEDRYYREGRYSMYAGVR